MEGDGASASGREEERQLDSSSMLLELQVQREEEEDGAEGAEEEFQSRAGGGEALVRLFVGWVPKHFESKDLLPIFSRAGGVKDCIIMRDKTTNQARGCAFVSFATRAEAERAVELLDKKEHLEGALCPLEVRFAKSHNYIQAGSGPSNNRQLFYSNAPSQLHEEEISTFFSQFGSVEEVNLFRERKTGSSKGCGFVTMQTREQALNAIEALELEPADTMQIKWADPELQVKKKRAVDESNADNRMIFFAKVLRSATEDEVRALFSGFGKVYDVNLFRAFQGAPTTKGCGLVTMATHEQALSAIDQLDAKFVWAGMESAMVVKWMDAALQRRRREQHLASMRQSLVANIAMGDAWIQGKHGLPGLPPAYMPFPMPEPEASEAPPAGCTQDAIKLFVGNIPKQSTEEQLMPFFETVGKVVELVIVRDKVSHESKGSAFLWYAARVHAERAILQFNLRHVLPDPSGDQDRPLVVRRAKARTPKAPGLSMGGMGGMGGPGLGQGHGPGLGGFRGMGGVGFHGGQGGQGGHQGGMHPSLRMLAAGGVGPGQGGLAFGHRPMGGGVYGPGGPGLLGLGGGPGGGALGGGGMGEGGGGNGNGNGNGMSKAQAGHQQQVQLLGSGLEGLQIVPMVGPTGAAGLAGASSMPYATPAQNSGWVGGVQGVGGGPGGMQAGGRGGGGGSGFHAGAVQQGVLGGGGAAGAHLVSIQGAPLVQEAGLYEAYGAGGVSVDAYVSSGVNGAVNGSAGSLSALEIMSIPVNSEQLTTINAHLFTIQTMSGAQVQITPGPAGLFHLVMSGGRAQLDVAKGLMGSIIPV